MRIIILTAIPFWHPGTSELILHLRKRGVDVTALDIFHGKQVNSNNEIVNLIPFGLTGFAARVYMKLFRKSFTRKHTTSADILDIHFVEAAYSKYIPNLGKKYICTLFGSDLYRTEESVKNEQRILFDTCDRILLSKNMIPYFEEHFGNKSEKYILNQYGSARIDTVYEALKTLNKSKTQEKWNIPAGKTVITIGYNGKQEQQHVKVIQELSNLTKEAKSGLFCLLPMTYGGAPEYLQEVANKMNNCGIENSILVNRLSDAEITELRIISDITINTQTTDALASSIKEAMVSGDVLLVGDWLPYEIYEELGVFYRATNFESLQSDLGYVLKDVDKLQQESTKNADIIRKFASWEVLIDAWVNDYQKLYNESK
ncbi:MAG: glycosyltransferase [bacterium]|nr:glycosyltransferase [bacterium]